MIARLTSHYSIGQDIARLQDWAQKRAREVQAMVAGSKLTPLFCYTGLSGTSLATGLAYEYNKLDSEFGMMYIRKDEEKSHADWAGRRQETSFPLEPKYPDNEYMITFVDDCIDSGATLTRVLRRIDTVITSKPSLPKINLDEMIICLESLYNPVFKEKITQSRYWNIKSRKFGEEYREEE